MNKMKIAKEFHWEMSHRLPYHKGPCSNIHGHSYQMRIEVEGTLDEHGMLLDYYDLDKITAPLVNKLDHAFICDDKDLLMINFLQENNFKIVVVPFYTTAENITVYILKALAKEFKSISNLHILRVRLFETKDVYAEMETEL